MFIKTKLAAGISKTDKGNSYLIEDPSYLIVNEFDDFTSSSFLGSLNRVNNLSSPYIGLNIDSYGGSVFALMGIKNAIDACDKIVVGSVQSMAMSCGAVLLSCCTRGYRYASEDSVILIHQAATHLEGKSSDIVSDAKNMELLNDKLMEILAKNCNKPKSFFHNLIKKGNNADVYLTAQEALQINLIDHIGIPEICMNVRVDYEVSNKTSKVAKNAKKQKVKNAPVSSTKKSKSVSKKP